jgi:two-component sensor histidine kinase
VLLSALILYLIHRLRDALARARLAESKPKLYAREMSHRTANLIGIVQAVANMTFTTEGCPNEQRRLFNRRLAALGAALSSPLNERGAQEVMSLLGSVLLPFGDRIHLSGQSAAVSGETAASLAELATNAVKYGALSVDDGRVQLSSRTTDGDLILEWRESGRPSVDVLPARQGFGTRLLKRSLSKDAGLADVEPSAATLEAAATKRELARPLNGSIDSVAQSSSTRGRSVRPHTYIPQFSRTSKPDGSGRS